MTLRNPLIEGFFDGLRPVERLKVSEWADKYRKLSSVSSAEPGQWRTSRVPYMQEIMDKLTAHDVTEEIIFMKGAQVAATETGINWVGYVVHVAPGPMMIVMPTMDTMKRNSKVRIDPMIESTEVLKSLIKPARAKDSGNTTFQKEFPGGVLVMTGANSAAGLRSMPVRYLFLDEVDAYPLDVDGEGSPLELAKARTRTYSKKKMFLASTPTIHGQSIIEQEFEATDQRYYHVPCPSCGSYQKLEFENLLRESPEKVVYVCVHCDYHIEERFKGKMLAAGKWVSENPDLISKKRAGYHLSSLYSPNGWYSWQAIMEDYEKAEKENDDTKRKAFVNLTLGETWKERGDAPDWKTLYSRRGGFTENVPAQEVCFLTAGVDIQKDRIECEVVGWAKGKIQYSVTYRVMMGDTTQPKVWQELEELLSEEFTSEDGRKMKILLMSVDSGYNSQQAYDFCSKVGTSRAIPIKGSDKTSLMVSPPKGVFITRNGKKIGKTKVWNLGVDLLKKELYAWLRTTIEGDEIPNGYCYFPAYDEHYFRGITAEQQEFKKVKGYMKYTWVKKYARNEPLDCRIYARAAAYVLGMDRWNDAKWESMRGVSPDATVSRKKKKTPKTSSFWN